MPPDPPKRACFRTLTFRTLRSTVGICCSTCAWLRHWLGPGGRGCSGVSLVRGVTGPGRHWSGAGGTESGDPQYSCACAQCTCSFSRFPTPWHRRGSLELAAVCILLLLNEAILVYARRGCVRFMVYYITS